MNLAETEMTPEMQGRVTTCTSDRGGLTHETAERATILHHLAAKGFIDDWQEDYVWTFLELRHAWLKGSSCKTNTLYSRFQTYQAIPLAAGEFYDLVAFKIKKSVKVIVLVISPYKTMAIAEIDIYRQAIDKLTSAMDEVKKELAERIVNE